MSRHFQFGKYEISTKRLQENILSVRNSKKNNAMPSQVISPTIRDMLLDFKDHGKFPMSVYHKLEGGDRELMERLLKQSGLADELGIRILDEEMGKLIQQYEEVRKKIMDGTDDPEVVKQLKRSVLALVRHGKLPLKVSYAMLLELAIVS